MEKENLFRVSVFKEDDKYFGDIMACSTFLYDNYAEFCEFPVTVVCLTNNKKYEDRISGMTKREITRTLKNLME